MTKVAVIGAGLIGRSWSIVFARAGFQVNLWDPFPRQTEAAMTFIADRLPELRQAGLLADEPADVLARIAPVGNHVRRRAGRGPSAETAPNRFRRNRHCLLVEDEKRLQLDLAPLYSAKARARLDAEDVIAGMGKAGPQLLNRGRRLNLLLHAATLIGQLDYEFRHSFARPGRTCPAFQGASRQFSGYQFPSADLVMDRRDRQKQRSKQQPLLSKAKLLIRALVYNPPTPGFPLTGPGK